MHSRISGLVGPSGSSGSRCKIRLSSLTFQRPGKLVGRDCELQWPVESARLLPSLGQVTGTLLILGQLVSRGTGLGVVE